MPDESHQRLFSEKDVGRILKRATEMQEVEGPSDAAGITLEDLRQIAREVGIDPAHVAAAVAELQAGAAPERRFHVLGAPVTFHAERVVRGTVDEHVWEDMVDEVRKAFNLVGSTSQVGRGFEWTHASRRRQVQVRVSSRDGQTRLRVDVSDVQSALFTFLPPMMITYLVAGILFGALQVNSALFAASVAIGLLAAMFAAMRFVWARKARKKEADARRLLDRLGQLASREASAEPAALVEGERLDASVLDDIDEDPQPSSSGRRLHDRDRS